MAAHGIITGMEAYPNPVPSGGYTDVHVVGQNNGDASANFIIGFYYPPTGTWYWSNGGYYEGLLPGEYISHIHRVNNVTSDNILVSVQMWREGTPDVLDDSDAFYIDLSTLDGDILLNLGDCIWNSGPLPPGSVETIATVNYWNNGADTVISRLAWYDLTSGEVLLGVYDNPHPWGQLYRIVHNITVTIPDTGILSWPIGVKVWALDAELEPSFGLGLGELGNTMINEVNINGSNR